MLKEILYVSGKLPANRVFTKWYHREKISWLLNP